MKRAAHCRSLDKAGQECAATVGADLEVGPYTGGVVASESVLQSELQNPGRRSRLKRRDPAEVCKVQIQIRISQVDVVQQVERLESKLEVLDLGEMDIPGQRHVDGPAWRSLDVIDRQVA